MIQNEPYKVSVCVPIYGVEKYIERCVRSLFEQTYQNIEYIFVNDCTPDKSILKLESILKKYPLRGEQSFIINHERNRGLSAARNTALEAATGDFIYWVDSDDYIVTGTIEKLVRQQQIDDADIVSAHYLEDWGDKRNKKQMLYSPDIETWKNMVLRRDTMISIWGRLIRKNLYTNNNIRAIVGCNMGEDFQVTPRLFFYAKRLAMADDYLYVYNRSNETAYSFRFSEEKINQIFRGLDLIKSFYSDKGTSYLESLNIGEARMLGMYTISCVRGRDRNYYKSFLRKRMDAIPPTVISQLSISLRLVYALKSYPLLRVYCGIGHILKRKG